MCLAITFLSTIFWEAGNMTGSVIRVPMMGSRNSSGASLKACSSDTFTVCIFWMSQKTGNSHLFKPLNSITIIHMDIYLFIYFIYPIQQSLGSRPSTRCHDKVFVCVSKLFWVGVKCVCNVWVLWEVFSPKVIQLSAYK